MIRLIKMINLMPIDIGQSEFGENFDPSTWYHENKDRGKNRELVLKMLKKIVDLSNSNLRKNADGLLAKRSHNKDLLWVGGSRIPVDQFALSY